MSRRRVWCHQTDILLCSREHSDALEAIQTLFCHFRFEPPCWRRAQGGTGRAPLPPELFLSDMFRAAGPGRRLITGSAFSWSQARPREGDIFVSGHMSSVRLSVFQTTHTHQLKAANQSGLLASARFNLNFVCVTFDIMMSLPVDASLRSSCCLHKHVNFDCPLLAGCSTGLRPLPLYVSVWDTPPESFTHR